jgi:hypothetical protein
MNAKIRNAQLERFYMLVVGAEQEAKPSSGSVQERILNRLLRSLWTRGGG